MSATDETVRWCHAVWVTHGRRALFKLAGHASFCERAMVAGARAIGVEAVAVRVTPTSVHALLRAPPGSTNAQLYRRLRLELTIRLRQARIGRPWPLPIWARGSWCVTVRPGPSATRLQRRLRQPAQERGQ